MKFMIVTCVRDQRDLIVDCMRYIDLQTYTDYKAFVTDDASSDGTWSSIESFRQSKLDDPRWSFKRTPERLGALRNQRFAAQQMYEGNDDDVVVFLDGDDRFYGPTALEYLALVYSQDNVEMTYGSYQYDATTKGCFPAIPYSYDIKSKNAYRWHQRNKGTSYNHLRTVRYRLYNRLTDADFQTNDGEWLTSSTDMAVMIPALEMANGRVQFVSEKLLNYSNDLSNSDTRLHGKLIYETDVQILGRDPKEPINPEFKEPRPTPEQMKTIPELKHYGVAKMLRDIGRFYCLRFFVETGTADGATSIQMVSDFEHVYTVELDDQKFSEVRYRFEPMQDRVTQWHASSADVMPEILELLESPALFWLDAHYCGGPIRYEVDTPIEDELKAIMTNEMRHLIVIDDADLFKGMDKHTDDFDTWPHVDALKMAAERYDYDFDYKDMYSVIVLTPKEWIEKDGRFTYDYS